MAWWGTKFVPNYAGNVRSYRPGIPTYHIQYDNALVNAATSGEKKMSTALWCDKGEHAFSAKDPDKQHFTKTQEVQVETGNSYGTRTYQPRMEITEELDICGPCWKSGNDFAKPKEILPTLDDLEKAKQDYEDGYNAAMEKILNTPKPSATATVVDNHATR